LESMARSVGVVLGSGDGSERCPTNPPPVCPTASMTLFLRLRGPCGRRLGPHRSACLESEVVGAGDGAIRGLPAGRSELIFMEARRKMKAAVHYDVLPPRRIANPVEGNCRPRAGVEHAGMAMSRLP